VTTAAAAANYEAQHTHAHRHRGSAVFNPHNKPVVELPTIYGFNNGGGGGGFLSACLLAEDGTPLGSHACSSEGYMPADLGILEGTRPDRHATFQQHYHNGYKMEFVGYDAVPNHAPLNAAFKLNEAKFSPKPA